MTSIPTKNPSLVCCYCRQPATGYVTFSYPRGATAQQHRHHGCARHLPDIRRSLDAVSALPWWEFAL